LIHYSVIGEILNIIKSLYNNINLLVKHNNELSEAFNCYVGVFQGDCLSVFSFSIYVNDLEQFDEDGNRWSYTCFMAYTLNKGHLYDVTRVCFSAMIQTRLYQFREAFW